MPEIPIPIRNGFKATPFTDIAERDESQAHTMLGLIEAIAGVLVLRLGGDVEIGVDELMKSSKSKFFMRLYDDGRTYRIMVRPPGTAEIPAELVD